MKKPKKHELILGGIILAIVGVVFFFILSPGSMNITVTEEEIKIPGMYGLTIPFTDIEGITLVNESMNSIGAGRRRNGSAVGGNLRGHFDAGLLFIQNANQGPTIRIDRRSANSVFINYSDSAETQSLYESIRAQMK